MTEAQGTIEQASVETTVESAAERLKKLSTKETSNADNNTVTDGEKQNEANDNQKPEGDTPDEKETSKTPDDEDETKEGGKEEEIDLSYKLKVKVDGKVEDVTLDDLMRNYSGKTHWDRKNQELATQRKEIEEKSMAVEADKYNSFQQVITPFIQKDIEALNGLEKDIGILRNSNRDNYDFSQTKTNGQLLQEHLVEHTLQKQDLELKYNQFVTAKQNSQALNEGQLDRFADEQVKDLYSKRPDFQDKDLSEIRSKAFEKLGLTEQQATTPWRADDFIFIDGVLALKDKADKYDALMAKKPKIEEEVKRKPNFVKSGIVKTKADIQSEHVNRARAELRKTNSLDSAARAIRQLGI